MNQIELEHLKRVTDICTNRGELIEKQSADLDRANIRIIAKDMQIAELTRMLFALGKQDGQTIHTQAAEINTIKAAIEDIKIYCNNPSAWEYYDDGVSEKIRAILKAAGMA